MSNPKGTRFATAVVTYLNDNGHPYVERRVNYGAKDKGDLTGLPGWAIEIKNERAISLAQYMTEAETEARNAKARYFAAIVKRRQKGPGDAYVILPLRVFAKLLADEDGTR